MRLATLALRATEPDSSDLKRLQGLTFVFFEDGADAARHRRPVTANPYTSGMAQHWLWVEGGTLFRSNGKPADLPAIVLRCPTRVRVSAERLPFVRRIAPFQKEHAAQEEGSVSNHNRNYNIMKALCKRWFGGRQSAAPQARPAGD